MVRISIKLLWRYLKVYPHAHVEDYEQQHLYVDEGVASPRCLTGRLMRNDSKMWLWQSPLSLFKAIVANGRIHCY